MLADEEDAGRQLAVLRAVHEALKGRRRVEMPEGWSAAFNKLSRSKDAEIRSQATALAVTFGDPKAFADLRRVVRDRAAAAAVRQSALASLIDAHDKDLAPLLQTLVGEKSLRAAPCAVWHSTMMRRRRE
jgi:hypothetical protein